MELILLERQALLQQLESVVAADTVALIADQLRSELSARTTCSRRALCERVRQQLDPIKALELDEVRDVLSELENNGDVTPGPRGVIAAAPLRLVILGAGRYLVRGAISNRSLRRYPTFATITDAVSGYSPFRLTKSICY